MRQVASAFALWVLCGACALAQYGVTFLSAAELPGSAVDQNGLSFMVSGLSGVTHLGGSRFAAAMDNDNKVLLFDLVLADDGAIQSISNVDGLTLSVSGDHEGIGWIGASTVLISDESSMELEEFGLADGLLVRTLALPSVFDARRGNLGLESLSVAAGFAWTANEEALSVDGPRSTPDQGTVVRLLRARVSDGTSLEQHAYVVEPMHGGYIPFGNPGQSGLSDIVALPDGGFIALERSLAFVDPLFLTRLYAVRTENASDVSALDSLDGANFVPVQKTLLYLGGHNNLEGLCLGPELAEGGHALVGVTDDGDPLSSNTVVVFRLDGVIGQCAADLDQDGDADADDFFAYLDLFASGDWGADIDGDSDIDADDFFGYLDLFVQGC